MGYDLQTYGQEELPALDVFVKLLRYVSKYNVHIKQKTAVAILRNYALESEGRTLLQFVQLLAAVVKIDSEMFVDEPDYLADVLAATRDVGYGHQAEYSILRDEILIPILKTHVAARSLDTFLEFWHDELIGIYREWPTYMKRDSLSENAPIWEDTSLVQVLGRHLETARTTRQLMELVAGLARILTSDKEPYRVAAHASMLNCILTALHNVDSASVLLPTIRELFEPALAVLQSLDNKEQNARTRLWFLIATLHRLYTSAAAPVDTVKLATTYDLKLDSVISMNLQQGQQNLHKSISSDLVACIACLGSVLGDVQSRHIALASFTSPSSLVTFLRSIKAGVPTFVLLDLSMVLSRFPVLQLQEGYSKERATRVSATYRTWLHTLKSTGRETDSNMIENILSSADVVRWNGVLNEIDDTKTADSAPKPKHDGEYGATLDRLSRVSFEQCRGDKRRMYINMIDNVMQSAATSTEGWSAALSYLLRILQDRAQHEPHPCDSAVDVYNIAIRLDKHIKDSASPAEMTSLSLLFYEVYRLVLESRLDEGEDQVEQELQKDIQNLVNDSFEFSSARIASLALLKAVMGTQTVRGSTPSWNQEEIFMNLYRQLAASGVKTDPPGLAASFDLLASVDDDQLLAKCYSMVGSLLTNKAFSTIDDISVKTMRYCLECRLNRVRHSPPDLEKTLALVAVVKSRQNARLVETATLETVKAATPNERREFVTALMPTSEKSFFGQERLQLLHVLVKASSSKRYRVVLPEEMVAPLASSMQHSLPKLSNLSKFTSTAQSLQYLLESHPKHLPQSVIENMLLTISGICSPSSSPNIPPTPQTARHIVTLTTNLLQTLLTHHRRKLRGRFELVVLALQALLRCLFTSSGTNTFGRIQQPTWIPRKSSSVDGKGLDASHVTQYTRLLTSICDPTLSAVRSGSAKSGTGLTDETRKAKRYAGQYVQYVLMELCECQLKGRLVGGADGAREALTPGVWAMLEVIGKDGLSACMEGMAGGGRSVLRGWWEEWRTIGRGRW